MKLTSKQITKFVETVLAHYDQRARHELPWRQPQTDGSFDAYNIWVSELMLQQTQVNRVIPKYTQFLSAFPNVQALAAANLGEVLTEWQGLGYNRRAKFLWQAANQLVQTYNSKLPQTLDELVQLPGIGRNTAGAILVYAHNQPALFVETNIRTVYFHHFFQDTSDISDAEVLDLLGQTIDTANPRQFYWALMDYGTYLKQQKVGAIQKSKHYVKQSTFQGSSRQIRGAVIRRLTQGPVAYTELLDVLADSRAPDIIEQLEKEALIRRVQDIYSLA